MKLSRVCSFLIFLLSILCIQVNAQIYEWNFKNNDLYDLSRTKALKYNSKQIQLVEFSNGKALTSISGNDVINLPLQYKNSNKFHIELSFQGTSFSLISISKQLFRYDINENSFSLRFSFSSNNKTEIFNIKVPLNSTIPYNGIYLSNGDFHKIDLYIDGQNGSIELIIDDVRRQNFKFTVKKFNSIVFENNGGFRLVGSLAKLKIGNTFQQIKYSNQAIKISGDIYDYKEFATKYNLYEETTYEQLKNYPSPRLKSGYDYKRNFPWFDITYLSWTHQPANSRGTAEMQSKNAVELMSTLHDQWNYYYEIPILRTDLLNADKTYSSKQTVPGALVDYARSRKDLKTAGILIQMQNNPKHIGSTYTKNLEWSAALPNKYYVKDQTGKLILHNLKKVISPIAPLDFKYTDAKNSVFYLNNMVKYLGRPLDFINENGEINGHKIPMAVFEKDPSLKKDIQVNGKNNVDIYNGYLQNRLDTAYKNEILRQLKWKNTQFSFYNVSAYNANYWPSYAERRTSNNTQGSNHYSTPSFYPASATYWYNANGSRNGLYNIIEGRVKEIQMGDKLFSPFISAGWDVDEKNILPSQWLALNKALVLFGAEYFYVGYFNVTGTKGWANGKGPNDPRGYLYQLAMPVYAQALFPYIEKFILEGEFVGGEKSGNQIYRVPASKNNHLVYVKKHKNDYVIVGSIQRNANFKNLIPEEEITEITIEGKRFRFKVRPQGSVYILNEKNQSYVIRQIDSWHEQTHPSWWSKNTLIEAEILDSVFLNYNTYQVTNVKGVVDFTNFTTSVNIKTPLQITATHVFKKINLLVKGNGIIEILGEKIQVNSDIFKTVEIDFSRIKMLGYTISILPIKGSVEIDNVLILREK